MVAPEKYRRFLSYAVGYCVLVCEISVAAGCALNSASIVATFVAITHPQVDWKVRIFFLTLSRFRRKRFMLFRRELIVVEQPYMTYLLYCGFLILPLITGLSTGSRYARIVQLFAGSFNVCGLVVWAVVFLAMAPKTDAAFIFTKFVNNSGWDNDAWVFILSLYTPIYGLYGTDGVMHRKLSY